MSARTNDELDADKDHQVTQKLLCFEQGLVFATGSPEVFIIFQFAGFRLERFDFVCKMLQSNGIYDQTLNRNGS